MRQFEEKFGKRVLVSCNDLSFNLQGCVADSEEGPTTNVRVVNSLQTGHSLFSSVVGHLLKCNYLNKKSRVRSEAVMTLTGRLRQLRRTTWLPPIKTSVTGMRDDHYHGNHSGSFSMY